jgi:hypothetical protein
MYMFKNGYGAPVMSNVLPRSLGVSRADGFSSGVAFSGETYWAGAVIVAVPGPAWTFSNPAGGSKKITTGADPAAGRCCDNSGDSGVTGTAGTGVCLGRDAEAELVPAAPGLLTLRPPAHACTKLLYPPAGARLSSLVSKHKTQLFTRFPHRLFHKLTSA